MDGFIEDVYNVQTEANFNFPDDIFYKSIMYGGCCIRKYSRHL